MPAGSREPVVLQDRGKFHRRLPVEVVQFHFLVANPCDQLHRAQQVFGELIAQRVELEPDRFAQGIGKKPARHPRGDCGYSKSALLQEFSSVDPGDNLSCDPV